MSYNSDGIDETGHYNRQADDNYWDRLSVDRARAAQTPEQQRNNPTCAPTGNFTGRCRHCGSSDLWDDNLHYGCNSCHRILA